MKRRNKATIITAVTLMLIIIGCSASQLYQQRLFNYSYTQETDQRLIVESDITSYRPITIDKVIILALTPSLTTQTVSNVNSVAVNYTRSRIFDFISQNPGVHFRAISNGLHIPLGLAQFHLGVLVKSGLVLFIRDGKYKRFFVTKKFSKKDMFAICLLRHYMTRRIFETLLSKSNFRMDS